MTLGLILSMSNSTGVGYGHSKVYCSSAGWIITSALVTFSRDSEVYG